MVSSVIVFSGTWTERGFFLNVLCIKEGNKGKAWSINVQVLIMCNSVSCGCYGCCRSAGDVRGHSPQSPAGRDHSVVYEAGQPSSRRAQSAGSDAEGFEGARPSRAPLRPLPPDPHALHLHLRNHRCVFLKLFNSSSGSRPFVSVELERQTQCWLIAAAVVRDVMRSVDYSVISHIWTGLLCAVLM